jgi:hypothetical protein
MTELEKLHQIFGWKPCNGGQGDLITLAPIKVTDAEQTAQRFMESMPQRRLPPEVIKKGRVAWGRYINELLPYPELKEALEKAAV